MYNVLLGLRGWKIVSRFNYVLCFLFLLLPSCSGIFRWIFLLFSLSSYFSFHFNENHLNIIVIFFFFFLYPFFSLIFLSVIFLFFHVNRSCCRKIYWSIYWVVGGVELKMVEDEVDFTLDHITEEMNVKELSHPLFTPLNMIWCRFWWH